MRNKAWGHSCLILCPISKHCGLQTDPPLALLKYKDIDIITQSFHLVLYLYSLKIKHVFLSIFSRFLKNSPLLNAFRGNEKFDNHCSSAYVYTNLTAPRSIIIIINIISTTAPWLAERTFLQDSLSLATIHQLLTLNFLRSSNTPSIRVWTAQNFSFLLVLTPMFFVAYHCYSFF
jgi:hypothetical protein